MSFFNQMLSKVGIGAAKVDTHFSNPTLTPGETLRGNIWVKGGHAEQAINEINLNLMCLYTTTEHTTDAEGEPESIKVPQSHLLSTYFLGQSFLIQPGEQRNIPFEIPLPRHTPLSIGESQVWVDTHLDIDFALDQNDKDLVHVQPNALQQRLFDAMHELGFALHESDCEAAILMHNQPVPFVQEFEFKPTTPNLQRKFKEVELVFFPNDDGSLHVLLEIDRKTQGLMDRWLSAFNWDEAPCHLRLYPNQIDQVRSLLNERIKAHH
jgi:sporulation-control protein